MDFTIEEQKAALQKLREPFPEHQVGKLAKGSKAQTQCDPKEKKNCTICGGWHHPKMIHLDFVGHAALTDRLLDCDIGWTWEPFATTEVGLPAYDESGGLWIRLTVAGMTRPGYGHAPESQYKEIGSREKETIGDALRNAAMRFGAALELWHKGDLHVVNPDVVIDDEPPQKTAADYVDEIDKLGSAVSITAWKKDNEKRIRTELAHAPNEITKVGTYCKGKIDIFKEKARKAIQEESDAINAG